MNRRAFLAASAATVTMAGAKTAAADALPLGPLPEMRYPDARIESADKKFFGTHFPAFAGTAGVERVATGFRWAEGPAFFREGNYLLFSDIPNNRIMRLLWDDNHLSVFREPSNNSNGNTVDPQGRLVTCEHRTRRVTRTELDGSITVIADKYRMRPLVVLSGLSGSCVGRLNNARSSGRVRKRSSSLSSAALSGRCSASLSTAASASILPRVSALRSLLPLAPLFFAYAGL